ncbi:MAG: tetratricopeptide repeat protein [bacterium]|nr:tetratricopeptide repeat protein [bacterium]
METVIVFAFLMMWIGYVVVRRRLFIPVLAAFNSGNYERGLLLTRRLLRVFPRDPLLLYNRGLFLAILGEEEAAQADLTQALKRRPKFISSYIIRAYIHIRHKRYREAVQEYDAALRIDPDAAYLYTQRATAHLRVGDLLQAMRDVNRALELLQSQVQKQERFGAYIMGAAGSTNETRMMLAAAYAMRAAVYNRQGSFAASDEDYTRAASLTPDYAFLYNDYAENAFTAGDYGRALDLFQQADTLRQNVVQPPFHPLMQIRPLEEFTQAGTAVTHSAMGNDSTALDLWKRLTEKEPRYHDPDWVRSELNWPDAMIAEGRKLIDMLGNETAPPASLDSAAS